MSFTTAGAPRNAASKTRAPFRRPRRKSAVSVIFIFFLGAAVIGIYCYLLLFLFLLIFLFLFLAKRRFFCKKMNSALTALTAAYHHLFFAPRDFGAFKREAERKRIFF
jgi:ABC-type transport system involved in cytochrome bd biosynthesis fused ATPase/permease subunit